MKQLLYFLIGFLFSICVGIQFVNAECTDLSDFYERIEVYERPGYIVTFTHYQTESAAYSAALAHYNSLQPPSSNSAGIYNNKRAAMVYYAEVIYPVYDSEGMNITHRVAIINSYGSFIPCAKDTDGDNIPDGLDAYPDTDSAYQFRIMTNYFDSQGNCVGQLIVTSSGDYVLLGDLTAAEIEAGVSAGIYKSDFVNSPIWIDSSDLKDDNASNIYASGDSTTPVTSTTASGLANSATTANAGDLSTADGVTSGSTYDSGTDTDSAALGKIVDNTAAATSNQQTLANYAKKQTELQGIGNSLGLYQSAQLAQMNKTLGEQATTAAEEKTTEEQDAGEGKTALEGLDVNALLGEDVNGELVEGEEGDYQDHGELMEETWVQELINSNPITTVLTNSGFQYSSGSPTAILNLGQLGTHTLDISDLEAGLIAFGNLLVSFTTLYGLVHVITGRGF